jgi:xyloglucan-specific exo-beta-1,4-glucanase
MTVRIGGRIGACIVSGAVAAMLMGSTPGRGEAYSWTTVTMGGGGFVSGIIAHPTAEGRIYARTDVGGAYRWDPAAGSWIPLTDWLSPAELGLMGVESLAVDPRRPERVFMLAGTRYWNGGRTAILRSADAGNTWEVIDVTKQWVARGNSLGRQSGEKLAVDPRKSSILLCGTRDKGLFTSTNSGKTWSEVASFPVKATPNGNGVAFVVFGPDDGEEGSPTQTIYVGVSQAGDNIFRSRDGGTSWTPIMGGPKDLMPQRCAMARDGTLYVTFANGAGPHGDDRVKEPYSKGAVGRLDADSQQWQDITPGGRSVPYCGIDVDPRKPGRVIVSTINCYQKQPWGWGDRFYLTSNRGKLWTDLIGQRKITMDDGGFPWIEGKAIHWAGCIRFDPLDPKRVFVTSGNGIFRTNNVEADAARWIFTARGLEETVPMDFISPVGRPPVSVILDYDGFVHDDIRSSPRLGNHRPPMGSVTGLAVADREPDAIARVGKLLQISRDGGREWTPAKTVPEPDASGGCIAFAADASRLFWRPKNSKILYWTQDDGQTWTAAKGLPESDTPRPVADPVEPRTVYCYHGATGEIFASYDAGESFAAVGRTDKGGNAVMRTAPGHEGLLSIALGKGGLGWSGDGGRTVTKFPDVTLCRAVGTGKSPAEKDFPTLYLWGVAKSSTGKAGKEGVYRSIDQGRTWRRINDDAHEYGGLGNAGFVVGDQNVFGRVYLSTAGRGVVVGEPATGEE